MNENSKTPEIEEDAPKTISLDSLSPDLVKLLTRAADRKQGVGPVARGARTLCKNFEAKKKAKKKNARAARKSTRRGAK